MIKVALIQFAPFFLEKEKTLLKLEKMFSEIKDADLIVLPELANTGYNFSSRKEAYASAENIDRSDFIEFLSAKAKIKNLFIVSGFNELDGSEIYNSSVLVGPEGKIGVYRKLHLFKKEKDFFTPGNLGLPVFDIGFGKIGMLICFDWMFPEAWRILARKGAGIICHPSNLVLPYAQQAVPVHCLINRIFAITCNRVGMEGGLQFTGRSMVADTNGSTIMKAPAKKEGVYSVSIDNTLSNDKMITENNHVFDDIRCRSYEIG